MESPFDILKQYQIEYLHHITSPLNVPSILNHGLCSRNHLKKRYLKFFDKANQDIINKSSISDQLDFVRLYFATQTPMQFELERIFCFPDDIINYNKNHKDNRIIICDDDFLVSPFVFLDFKPEEIIKDDSYITDGSLAGSGTEIYDTPIFKKNWCLAINWKIICEPNESWRHDNYPDHQWKEWKRKKASEVLVHDHIPKEKIKRIVVRNNETENRLNQIISHYEKKKDNKLTIPEIVINPPNYYIGF